MGRKLDHKIGSNIIFGSFFIFVALPLVYTFGVSTLGWRTQVAALDRSLFGLLLKSSLISLIISGLSTSVGVVLSFYLYKTKLRFSRILKLVLLIPLFVSPYILAVAWKDLFYVLGLGSGWSASVGMIGVLTMIFVPLSVLIIGSALTNIDANIEESGLMLTSFNQVFWKIILPLIKPALVSSMVLVFIFSISEFSVPAYFGVKVFTTEIFTQFSAFYNHSLAILQSVFLVLICISLLFAERRYLADAPFLSVGAKGTKHKIYETSNNLGQWLVLGWLLISVVLPVFVLFAQAAQGGIEVFLKAYNLLRHSFLDSFILAFLGALLISLVGLAAGLNHFRKGSGRSYFDGLLLLIFAIPSTILGISLIKFYNQPALNFIYSSYAIILIGYVGKFAFIAAKIIGNTVRQLPKSLDESAEIMGISYGVRLRKIVLPMLLPSIFIAFIVGFILSLGELGITIMLYPPGTEIMPIKVFTIMANAPESLTSAMVWVVLMVSMIAVVGLMGLGQLLNTRHHGN